MVAVPRKEDECLAGTDQLLSDFLLADVGHDATHLRGPSRSLSIQPSRLSRLKPQSGPTKFPPVIRIMATTYSVDCCVQCAQMVLMHLTRSDAPPGARRAVLLRHVTARSRPCFAR